MGAGKDIEELHVVLVTMSVRERLNTLQLLNHCKIYLISNNKSNHCHLITVPSDIHLYLN